MNSALTSAIVFVCCVAAMLFGQRLRRHLPEHHLTGDSKDAVRLAMGLVATMTALLLGLLISSAKATYDTQRSQVIEMAGKVTFVDRAFAAYGPDATGVRSQFRASVAEAVQHMWPEESKSPPQLGPNVTAGDALFAAIQNLSPQNELQRSLKEQLVSQTKELAQLRMLLVAGSAPSIPKPMLVAVVSWLLVTYLFYSLVSPPNRTTTLAFVVSALSVAVAIFLVLDLDQPLGGWIEISSQPMQHALKLLAP